MSAQLTRLVNNARVQLPGALDDAIKMELFNAVDEFCKETDVWQEDIEFDSQVGVVQYTLTPTGAAQINRLMKVLNASAIGVSSTMSEPGEVVLNTIPSVAEDLTATVALTVVDPTSRDNFPQLPAWIVTQYYQDFLEGILGRMMAQAAKPYSNERLAIFHYRKFRNGLARAKANVRRQNLDSAQAWQFPKFA